MLQSLRLDRRHIMKILGEWSQGSWPWPSPGPQCWHKGKVAPCVSA